MHELSLVQDILKASLDAAQKAGASKVKEIHVTIRELGHPLEAESVEDLLRMLAEGTPAEDASLKVHVIPATLKCGECATTFAANMGVLLCPHCHSTKIAESDAAKIDLECSLE